MATQPNRYSALTWRKSSASQANGGCVEVANSDSSVLVRDSRDRLGAVVTFTSTGWRRFTQRVKSGKTDFD